MGAGLVGQGLWNVILDGKGQDIKPERVENFKKRDRDV